MYSLLIAEDEILERRMLEKIISNECPEISNLLLAKHGLEALSLARQHAPDILLVDINMPGLTGIDLIRTLRAEGYAGRVLILTAYSDFSYARQAIDLDVMGYLLKPVSPPELRSHLQKCFQWHKEQLRLRRLADESLRRLGEHAVLARPRLMREMLSGSVPERTLQTLCDWPPEAFLSCAVLRLSYDPPLPEETCSSLVGSSLAPFDGPLLIACAYDGADLFLLLQPSEPMPAEQLHLLLWMLATRFADGHPLAAQPKRHTPQESSPPLHPSMHSPPNKPHTSPLPTPPTALLPPQSPPTQHTPKASFSSPTAITLYPAQTSHAALLAILCQSTPSSPDVSAAHPGLSFTGPMPASLLPSLDALDVSWREARQRKATLRLREGDATRVYSLFSKLLLESSTCWAGVYMFLFSCISSVPESHLASLVCELTTDKASKSIRAFLSCELTPPPCSDGESVIIESALQLMRTRFAQPDFSQEWLARELGLSPAYFSRLFSKTQQESFVARLTSIRMDAAETFLSQGMSVSDVARACGYQSVKYFNTAYKQHNGHSVRDRQPTDPNTTP